MELVNSAPMQLGRWGFVDASMVMLTVGDTVAIATHLRSNVLLLWLLASCFLICMYVLLISLATSSIFVHQRSLSELQSSTGFPIFDGRLQDETNEGMKDQLKPMNIAQALDFCPATATV